MRSPGLADSGVPLWATLPASPGGAAESARARSTFEGESVLRARFESRLAGLAGCPGRSITRGERIKGRVVDQIHLAALAIELETFEEEFPEHHGCIAMLIPGSIDQRDW